MSEFPSIADQHRMRPLHQHRPAGPTRQQIKTMARNTAVANREVVPPMGRSVSSSARLRRRQLGLPQ